MSGGERPYRTPAAFRTALEERLRRRAQETGVALDRLRKEIAHQRLLARLAMVAPPGSWALKGGQALLARLDTAGRATKDADATWRATLETFNDVLEQAVDTDLQDGFTFEVAAPRDLTTETDEGGLRFPVRSLLDGREFERLQLDVNVLPGDDRPLEHLRLRDLLSFAGIDPPVVPVIPVSQHLAEKLHAFCRDYGSAPNTRPRDLYDMLVIARSIPLPRAGVVHAACRATFTFRKTAWPPQLPEPPAEWTTAWSAYVNDYDLPWTSIDEAADALAHFWQPLLVDEPPANATWHPERWRWSSE